MFRGFASLDIFRWERNHRGLSKLTRNPTVSCSGPSEPGTVMEHMRGRVVQSRSRGAPCTVVHRNHLADLHCSMSARQPCVPWGLHPWKHFRHIDVPLREWGQAPTSRVAHSPVRKQRWFVMVAAVRWAQDGLFLYRHAHEQQPGLSLVEGCRWLCLEWLLL